MCTSQRAIHRVKEQADHHRRSGPAYTPGQWVWLSTRNLRLRLPCKKLNPRYVGPCKIIRQITPVSYRLALPSNYRISPTFHVSLLKPAGCPRGERDEEEAMNESPPPNIVDGEEAYQVQEILDSRRRGRLLQYLIYWEGYVLRKDLGSMLRISWTLHSQLNSIEPTQTNQPLTPVEGLGIMYLLASGAARREGALSQIRHLWLSPIATGGHPLLSTSVHGLHTHTFSIHPVPGTEYWHRCFPLASSYKLLFKLYIFLRSLGFCHG